jgi:hypothetical protein
MELYYRWRAMRLDSLESTASFKAASAQEQQDMREANRMLKGDLAALRYRSMISPGSHEEEASPFSFADNLRVNQWHLHRAQMRIPLDAYEKWALAIFDDPKPLSAEAVRFFDDYVHDSFAGFYMAGEVTEYDKRVRVRAVMEKDRDHLDSFDKKVYDLTDKARRAQAKKKAGEPLTPEEDSLANEAEFGTPYPLMSDEDTGDMRSPIITTQTYTRREGGGYILQRGYYPHRGFFIRRSVNERELADVRAARAFQRRSTPDSPVEFAWSDNLQRDVVVSREAGRAVPELA